MENNDITLRRRKVIFLIFLFILVRTVIGFLIDVQSVQAGYLDYGLKNSMGLAAANYLGSALVIHDSVCFPYAGMSKYSFGVQDDNLAICKPDGEIASLGFYANSILILDMGEDNFIIDQAGIDLYYYEHPYEDGILMDRVQIALAKNNVDTEQIALAFDNDPIQLEGVKIAFIWGDQNPNNNGDIPAEYFSDGVEDPNKPIHRSDLHENGGGRGVGIDIGSDNGEAYRYVIFQTYPHYAVPVADERVEVDAVECIPTKTPTATIVPIPSDTSTPTDTFIPSTTPAPTQSSTSTTSPMPSDTPTSSNTLTPTEVIPSATPTPTQSSTSTISPMPSDTPTSSNTPTSTEVIPSATPTPTQSSTSTIPPTPSGTPIPSSIPVPTNTSSPSATPTQTKSPTATITPQPLKTSTPTQKSSLSVTPTRTKLPVTTITPSPSKTPLPSGTLTRTSPAPTATFAPSKTQPPVIMNTSTPTRTFTPRWTYSPTLTKLSTETNTPSPTPTETSTGSPTPTPSKTPSCEGVGFGNFIFETGDTISQYITNTSYPDLEVTGITVYWWNLEQAAKNNGLDLYLNWMQWNSNGKSVFIHSDDNHHSPSIGNQNLPVPIPVSGSSFIRVDWDGAFDSYLNESPLFFQEKNFGFEISFSDPICNLRRYPEIRIIATHTLTPIRSDTQISTPSPKIVTPTPPPTPTPTTEPLSTESSMKDAIIAAIVGGAISGLVVLFFDKLWDFVQERRRREAQRAETIEDEARRVRERESTARFRGMVLILLVEIRNMLSEILSFFSVWEDPEKITIIGPSAQNNQDYHLGDSREIPDLFLGPGDTNDSPEDRISDPEKQ